MAIKDRKERDKLDRRKLIIQSATKLFLEQGYEKTSIRNIADDIEYSPATIYLYFKEKDEIFFVLHEQGFELLNRQFDSHAHIENPLERLNAIGHSYLQFAIDNPDYYDLMFIMRAPLNEIACHDTWDAGTNAFTHLLQTVEQCMAQNMISATDPNIAAMTIWSYAHGLASLYIRQRFQSMQMCEVSFLQPMLIQSMDYFLKSMST